MTPAAHWSEADYYRASRRARAAWEATQPQLVLGLEGADAGTTSLVASAPSSPQAGLEARERVASSRHEDEGCYSLPDSQLSVGQSERKDTACHSDGLAPSHPSLASSPPSPVVSRRSPNSPDAPPRVGEGGLDNPTTRETWA